MLNGSAEPSYATTADAANASLRAFEQKLDVRCGTCVGTYVSKYVCGELQAAK